MYRCVGDKYKTFSRKLRSITLKHETFYSIRKAIRYKFVSQVGDAFIRLLPTKLGRASRDRQPFSRASLTRTFTFPSITTGFKSGLERDPLI